LRDPALLSVVIGRDVDPAELIPATLPGHEIRKVAGEAFPCLSPRGGAIAEGAIMDAVTEAEAARIIFFEDEEEFDLREITVDTPAGQRAARSFFARPGLSPGGPWSFQGWAPGDRALLTECAVEIMALRHEGVDWTDKAMWPGIKNRARARVRAEAENVARARGAMPDVGLAAMVDGAGMKAAQVDARVHPYASYFGIEEMVVRHPLHGGGLSAPVRRAAFCSGDAVTALPYDPAMDAVLLVSQWRAGPQARGDAHPYPVEVIAGRIDADESAEATARREAAEEAGLKIGRMERAGAYYPSPGVMAEHITSFIAEADLSGAGGVHGLDAEGEDIISVVLPYDRAMALMDAGAINSAPALVSLLWLSRRRCALRKAWLAD
jgi:nudix-type nucleoside diphosphatase (YffH/AdpP family)